PRALPASALTQERVHALGRNTGSRRLECEQRRRQRRPPTGARADRCATRVQLSDVRVAIEHRSERGEEEQRWAEDPPASEAQRIAYQPVVLLVGEDGVEFAIAEHLQRGLREVHPRSEVSGADRLRT